MKILRQHHIFHRRQVGHEMKLLKDEPYLLRPEAGYFGGRKVGQVLAVRRHAPLTGRIEAANDVQQRTLAGAGRAHHRDPFASFHAQRHVVEGVHLAVSLAQVFDLDNRHLRISSQFSVLSVLGRCELNTEARRHREEHEGQTMISFASRRSHFSLCLGVSVMRLLYPLPFTLYPLPFTIHNSQFTIPPSAPPPAGRCARSVPEKRWPPEPEAYSRRRSREASTRQAPG